MIESTLPSAFVEMANVQARHEDELLAKDNVVGVALGNKVTGGEDTGEPALTVLVESKMDPGLLTGENLVPSRVDDLLTDVQEVGTIQAGTALTGVGALPTVPVDDERAPAENGRAAVSLREAPVVQPLTQRVRPAMGGYSVGHVNVTAGTIATGCYDRTPFPGIPPRFYLLSNNHVLANSNAASLGDLIVQPGRADGGTVPGDVIGRLARFQPIQFLTPASAPVNLIDAAIAEVPFHAVSREIYYVGYVRRMYTAPEPNLIVQKTGRTTNYSTGRVQNINATVNVNFGGGRVARFIRQIITTNMSAPGDSGSLVTNLDNEGVGLLFAGSSAVTILNHLHFVQAILGIRITER